MFPYKSLCVYFLLVSCFACGSPGTEGQDLATWDNSIYVEEGGRQELRRYFKLLDAKSIYIKDELSYEDETEEENNFTESLIVEINASRFLAKKSKQQSELKEISKRLAFLIMSRLSYPYSFESISILHNGLGIEEIGDPTLASNSFEFTYASSEFDIPFQYEDEEGEELEEFEEEE